MTNLSKEYAEALFALALECSKKEEYYSELSCVCKLLSENEEYVELLSNPAISKGEKLSMVTEAFEAYVCSDIMSFICILCEKGSIASIFDCQNEYKKLLDASNSLSEVTVKSSIELTPEQKAKLKQKLEKKYQTSVSIEYVIDSALMGGLVIELDGKVIDASLRGRLQKVKDVMQR